MLQRAQSLVEQVKTQVWTTLRVVADLAQSLGVPASVTSLLTGEPAEPGTAFVPPPAPPAASAPRGARAGSPPPAPVVQPPARGPGAAAAGGELAKRGPGASAAPRRPSRKVALEGDRGRSSQVRALQPTDAIEGSTYLARIIWSLGIARLEGLGPLRPADMARIIMARCPVTLEPPNVARYIRRSQPSSIAVAHSEGSSHFYALTAEGQQLFEASFGAS
ncbi:MAG: hypothetical protein IPG96_15570 [Proteobacteria bacterium]|nr:hypothetical protein [Pseudomonadota bacterium]